MSGYPGNLAKIESWLEEHGELCTRDIYDLFLDNYPKKCPTMFQLANKMSQSGLFEKIGHEHIQFSSIKNNRKYAIWKIKEKKGVVE